MTSPLFQLAAAVARNASATVPTALVVPEAEKEPQKSPQTAKAAALALAYDRSQAAAAIVKAVQRWRESLAGMSNADIAAALDDEDHRELAAVWQAGEEYDALREED